jgi:predicted nuclease of predicted toxin-antitoxin system
VRLLIDNALSPLVAQRLRGAGLDVLHRSIVSADTDFGTILFRLHVRRPSVILFRHGAERDPEQQAAILQLNLPFLAPVLEEGSLVVIEPARIRIRPLPILELPDS